MNCCHTTESGGRASSEAGTRNRPASQTISQLPSAAIASTTLIGVVVEPEDANDVSAENQALIEFAINSTSKRRVLAELSRGLIVTKGDRVLFVMPANASLAVITSVLSPAKQRTTCETSFALAETGIGLSPSQELVLRDSESLCVTTSTGQTLVAIERGASGPIIRLGEGSLEFDMPGELHLMADSLRFTTRSGPISIQSETDDVVVQGRTIRLN